MRNTVMQFMPLMAALVTSLGLTPVARRLALRVGLVDLPNPRKIHARPTPLLGGLAIYAGVLLTTLVFIDGGVTGQVVAVLGAATLLLVVGILDDRGLLHHQVKLLAAMPAAALVLMMAGIRADVLEKALSSPSAVVSAMLYVLDLGITLLWVVGITAAFSILDHMDGLCAGIAAIAAVFFWWMAVTNGQILVALLALALMGAALGFLWWNFNPAKIFMGDGGAMFLGFMLATLGLKLRLTHVPTVTQWMVPVLILGVPIFDTTLVTVSRLRRGLIPFRSPGKDHTAHRLTNLGLSQRHAVIAMYALGFLSGFLASMISRVKVPEAFLLFVAVSIAGALLLLFLELSFEARLSRDGGSVK